MYLHRGALNFSDDGGALCCKRMSFQPNHKSSTFIFPGFEVGTAIACISDTVGF